MNLSKTLPSFSLLLVEDEKEAREIVRSMVALKFPQCTIYTAEHGEEGLHIFMEHTPDIVITDLIMPKMDGIDLALKTQAQYPNTKYIVISGSVMIADKFKEVRNCVCLTKPFDISVLFNAIKESLPELRQ